MTTMRGLGVFYLAMGIGLIGVSLLSPYNWHNFFSATCAGILIREGLDWLTEKNLYRRHKEKK